MRASRIAARVAHEWHDDPDHRFRSHGKENREFNAADFMTQRFASTHDPPICEPDSLFQLRLSRRARGRPESCDACAWTCTLC